jgi:hypothetical protein
MHTLVMSKWTMNDQMGPVTLLVLDSRVEIDDSEAARLGAMRELLGGAEDAAEVTEDGRIILFRRLDLAAPGGIGFMVTAQLFDEDGDALHPVPPTKKETN